MPESEGKSLSGEEEEAFNQPPSPFGIVIDKPDFLQLNRTGESKLRLEIMGKELLAL